MDSPRRPDRDTDPESAAAYEQACRFREALREEVRRLDEMAQQPGAALENIDAERVSLTRMLSELDRRFPES